MASLLRMDCCFPHVVSCVTDTFWDCCNSLGSCFGHDRDKNKSGIEFPSQSCEFLVCCMYVVVGLGLCWSGNEGMGCLINLVCLGATQAELEGWFSSPQPLNSTGREVMV